MDRPLREARGWGRIAAMDARVYLDLLARDAAVVEFEGPLLEARAAGEPPDVVEALEQAKTVALHVRAMLERRRRR